MILPEVRIPYAIYSPPSSPAAQKRLRDLKSKISAQSKKNFVLERDVRYLDSRIALLIQNRMALDEVPFSPALKLLPACLSFHSPATRGRAHSGRR